MAQPALVQAPVAQAITGTTTVSYGSPTMAGSSLYAAIFYSSGSRFTFTVTNAGNSQTFTKDADSGWSITGNATAQIFRLDNAAATTGVLFTASGGTPSGSVMIFELSGMLSGGSLDVSGILNASQTAELVTASGANALPVEFVIAVVRNSAGTTPGTATGYTTGTGNTNGEIDYKFSAAGGTQSAAWATLGAANSIVAAIAVYKPTHAYAATPAAERTGATDASPTRRGILHAIPAAERTGAADGPVDTSGSDVYTPPPLYTPPSTTVRRFTALRRLDDQPFPSVLNAGDLYVTLEPFQVWYSDGVQWQELPQTIKHFLAAVFLNVDVVQRLTAGALSIAPPLTMLETSGDPAYGNAAYAQVSDVLQFAWRFNSSDIANLEKTSAFDLIMRQLAANPGDAALTFYAELQWDAAVYAPVNTRPSAPFGAWSTSQGDVCRMFGTVGAIPAASAPVGLDLSQAPFGLLAPNTNYWWVVRILSAPAGSYQIIYDDSLDSGRLMTSANGGATWAALPGTPTFARWTDADSASGISAFSRAYRGVDATTASGVAVRGESVDVGGVAGYFRATQGSGLVLDPNGGHTDQVLLRALTGQHLQTYLTLWADGLFRPGALSIPVKVIASDTTIHTADGGIIHAVTVSNKSVTLPDAALTRSVGPDLREAAGSSYWPTVESNVGGAGGPGFAASTIPQSRAYIVKNKGATNTTVQSLNGMFDGVSSTDTLAGPTDGAIYVADGTDWLIVSRT